VRGSITIQAERQQALLRRVVRDETVYRWLTGPRPLLEQRGLYDPFHSWIDPSGYRLSDRVWRDAIDVRSRIDRLLDYHIAQGASAVDIADELERFLTPGARVMPNGDGVYAPEDVPAYPAHPHDLCSLLPVEAESRADTVRRLREEIRARTPQARAIQGMFNVAWLVQALLGGFLGEALERIRR
jgi:hypothetical protein